jgi:hypothetical protein
LQLQQQEQQREVKRLMKQLALLVVAAAPTLMPLPLLLQWRQPLLFGRTGDAAGSRPTSACVQEGLVLGVAAGGVLRRVQQQRQQGPLLGPTGATGWW